MHRLDAQTIKTETNGSNLKFVDDSDAVTVIRKANVQSREHHHNEHALWQTLDSIMDPSQQQQRRRGQLQTNWLHSDWCKTQMESARFICVWRVEHKRGPPHRQCCDRLAEKIETAAKDEPNKSPTNKERSWQTNYLLHETFKWHNSWRIWNFLQRSIFFKETKRQGLYFQCETCKEGYPQHLY